MNGEIHDSESEELDEDNENEVIKLAKRLIEKRDRLEHKRDQIVKRMIETKHIRLTLDVEKNAYEAKHGLLPYSEEALLAKKEIHLSEDNLVK